MIKRAPFNLIAMLFAAAAHAETARPFAAPSVVSHIAPPGAGSLGQVTVALGLVLAFIFGAAWLTRRLRGLNKGSTAALDIVASLPLGQKERAVLIRCGNTQILLGIAPGRVNTLLVLSEPVDIKAPERAAGETRPSFGAILKRSLGK